ncbi:MAG: hypothetical protein BAJALOKI1v1_2380001 [Promethearchaeota archaeon]|nr:MAG: hypothetical protein BAJALOKI1v1_2380001 [Candidatus Lokiarchaeota archaeon]
MNLNKNVKKKVYILLILATFLLSGLIAGWMLNDSINNESHPYGLPNDADPIIFTSDIDEIINGSGIDQKVRVYMENQSSIYNNFEFFDVSAPSDTAFLTYGDFNFTFQNNFTTDHAIEDHSALEDNFELENYRLFEMDTSNSNLTEEDQSFTPDMQRLTDDDPTNYVLGVYSDTTNKRVNLTLDADYTGQTTSFDGEDIEFNRSKILGFSIRVNCTIDQSSAASNANLSIQIKDPTNGWLYIMDPVLITKGSGQLITESFINENLKYITDENITSFRFIFNNTLLDFTTNLYELDVNPIYGFEIPITNSNELALEFDLKGNSSEIHGVYAWIRTLNTTAADDAKITISLYDANGTIARTQSKLSTKSIIPDSSSLLAQQDFDNYKGDELAFFDLPDVANLPLSNYYVVIESNVSEEIYSLVVIPQASDNDFGDKEIEHILLNGTISTDTWTYQNYDASTFKINVTRGYMPSDFETDGFINLTIDGISLQNKVNPNVNKSDETWGLGRWISTFTNYVPSNADPNFEVFLEWNTSITSGFNFNVTSYYVIAYHEANATATYEIEDYGTPKWTLNYTYDSAAAIFDTWNFTEFWFTYDDYNTAIELIDPNFESILGNTSGESQIADTPSLDKVVINNNTITLVDGIYSLRLDSFNAMSKITSYINYIGELLESRGFMHGDNMSIQADIRGAGSIAPTNGEVNATLYFPNGTIFKTDSDTSGVRTADKSLLSFTFGEDILLQVNESIPTYGKYQLGMIWGNGSLIGAAKIPIYIDYYNISFGNFSYIPELQQNLLEVKTVEKIGEFDEISPYNLHVASINKTTQFPADFYSFNNSDINQKYTHEISGYQLEVNLKEVLQNESIINPNEEIKFKVILENLDPIFEVDLKVAINLVSSNDEEWIINNGTTSLQTLDQSGSNNSIKEFDLTFSIPALTPEGYWQGLTAPIRQGGAKTIVTIYLEDEIIGTYNAPDIALLVNKTEAELEGTILSVKSSQTQAPALLHLFERDKCLYPPENTTFIANIIDENYISTYEVINSSYQLLPISEFTNIVINPQNPLNGSQFNLKATLQDEFGELLSNKPVICQYFNGSTWVNITSPQASTDVNGEVSFQIDTEQLTIPSIELQLQLTWEGNNTILNTSKTITVNLVEPTNEVLFFAQFINDQIHQGDDGYLRIFIQNQGTSPIKITNILFLQQISSKYYSYELVYLPVYTIIQQEALKLRSLNPGESTILDLAINFENPPANPLTFAIQLKAENLETNEIFSTQQLLSVSFLTPEYSDVFYNNFIIFMIALLILIWIIALFYSFRLKRKIETPKGEMAKKKEKPKKGKYVKVSELPKEKEPKPERTTDLDSLLEEEGLED